MGHSSSCILIYAFVLCTCTKIFSQNITLHDTTECIDEQEINARVQEAYGTDVLERAQPIRVQTEQASDTQRKVLLVSIASQKPERRTFNLSECQEVIELALFLIETQMQSYISHQSQLSNPKKNQNHFQPTFSAGIGANLNTDNELGAHAQLALGLQWKRKILSWKISLNILPSTPQTLTPGRIWNQTLSLDLGPQIHLEDWVFSLYLTGGINLSQHRGFSDNGFAVGEVFGVGANVAYQVSPQLFLALDLRTHLYFPEYSVVGILNTRKHPIFLPTMQLVLVF